MNMRCFAQMLSLACLLSLGCRPQLADQPDTAPVFGTILLDGSPLPFATVRFQPESGRFSDGVTDASGHFELRYNPETIGAKIGPHTVSVTTYRDLTDPNDLGSPPFEEILAEKYRNGSVLTATVKPGENHVDFNLKSDE